MVASGFGMNIKLIGSSSPTPKPASSPPTSKNCRSCPSKTSSCTSSAGERGADGDPDACTIYTVSADFFPWNDTARSDVTQNFGLESGPHGNQCPGQVRPFNPRLEAGTSNPIAGAFSAFTLKLNREDGDQYLGDLNFTMPPGLTANLHGITYCPEAAIPAAANTPGAAEQADPSCPAAREIGTTNVAAGPGAHPFHATGKMYMAGPFQGAPLSPRRDHPGARRAL